jgi:hypothetical protein
MRKYTFVLSVCLAVATTAIIFSACRKKAVTATEDTGYAADHATAEQTFNDVQTISDQASVTTGSLNFRTTATTSGGCATVTHSNDSVIIDFGPTDCTCHDGRKRRGKIIATFSGGHYADSGSVHTITFDNFYQNDNKITGTKTVTNMGHNAAGQPYFNVTVAGQVTRNGGGTISANWTRVRTWTAGYTTPTDWSDDVYEITGSGTITRADGSTVAVAIDASTPLVVALNCHWIESGSVVYNMPGNRIRTLNYGITASCDDNAQVVLPNGTTYNITLP